MPVVAASLKKKGDDTRGAPATLSGVSSGWTLVDGPTALTATAGIVTVATTDLGALRIPARDDATTASDSLTLTVTSSEGGSTTSAVETLVVTATAVAEPPTFSGSTAFSGSNEGASTLAGRAGAKAGRGDTPGASTKNNGVAAERAVFDGRPAVTAN